MSYLFTLLLLYFLPAIVAASRGHNSVMAILVLTLLLGWTGLGWIVAIVWSFTGNVARRAKSPTVGLVVNNVVASSPPAAINITLATNNVASLQRLNEQWGRELDDIARERPADARTRVEIIASLVEKGRREAMNLREEMRDGGLRRLADAPAPPASPTPLLRREGREGRLYYRNETPPAPEDYPLLRGNALFDLAVAGVAHYQYELDAAVGGRLDAPVYFRTNALVVAEPDNPHDSFAVAVYVAGWRVGYIPRADAEAFGAELFAIAGPGAYACRALIANGWPEWRVTLDVLRPLRT